MTNSSGMRPFEVPNPETEIFEFIKILKYQKFIKKSSTEAIVEDFHSP